MENLSVKTLHIENFKSIRDSGTSLVFKPLTVLIGHNGSGKSNLLDSLRLYQSYETGCLDEHLAAWQGLDNLRNDTSAPLKLILGSKNRLTATLLLEQSAGQALEVKRYLHKDTYARLPTPKERQYKTLTAFVNEVKDWQYLALPSAAGELLPDDKPARLLDSQARNLAAYLAGLDQTTLAHILASLQRMWPQLEKLQVSPQKLTVVEQGLPLSEHMLSTGLRHCLAYLAVLYNPQPPALLLIEEPENGLDVWVLSMLMADLQAVARLGRCQVILTSHSPHLLDLVALDQVLVAGWHAGGSVFAWPGHDPDLRAWAETFPPGRLYSMGQFERLFEPNHNLERSIS